MRMRGGGNTAGAKYGTLPSLLSGGAAATPRCGPPAAARPPSKLRRRHPPLLVELAEQAGRGLGGGEIDEAVAQVALVAEVHRQVEEVKGAPARVGRRARTQKPWQRTRWGPDAWEDGAFSGSRTHKTQNTAAGTHSKLALCSTETI